MPNDKFRGTWTGPERDTMEEAEADIDVVLGLLRAHARHLLPEFERVCDPLKDRFPEDERPVPGGAACNAKSRG